MRAIVTTLLLAAATLPLAGAAITDNFNDNSLNPWLWSVTFPFGGTGTISEVNQRLEITALGAGAPFASLRGIVEGDFDVQVSFTLLTDFGSLPQREGYGGDCGSPKFPEVPTWDESGRLRVARVGTTYFGYYRSASDWALGGTVVNPNASPTDLHLFVAGWGESPSHRSAGTGHVRAGRHGPGPGPVSEEAHISVPTDRRIPCA